MDDLKARQSSVYDRMKTSTLVKFHPDNSEPTDGEFNDIFNRHNKATPWFILMFVLSCLPTFCIEAERASLRTSKNMEGRCIFPQLLKNNWTMQMIAKFTQPKTAKYCSYIDFDYQTIQKYSFGEAMDMKKDLEELPPTKQCAVPLIPENYKWTRSNFLKTCASLHFKDNATTYQTAGEIVSVMLLGTIGDLWGRKVGLWFSYPALFIGMILLLAAKHYYVLCTAYFFEGFGYAGWYLLSYVLFVELCNPKVRGILCLYLTSWGILAKILAYYIKLYSSSLFTATLLCSIPSLSLLFYLYYVPESPRWLLSHGNKKEAWRLLDKLNVDISEYKFLPKITLSKPRIFLENLQILFFKIKYLRSLLGLGILLCVQTILYEHRSAYVNVKYLTIPSHRMILFLADIFSFFNVLPPFIVFGRYISLLTLHIATLIYLCINIVIVEPETWFIINTMIVMSVSSMRFVILLYCCELIPTCVRATGLAITWIIALITKAILVYCTRMILGNKTEKLDVVNYLLFAIGILGLLGIFILPNLYVYYLPDFKRYRNVIET